MKIQNQTSYPYLLTQRNTISSKNFCGIKHTVPNVTHSTPVQNLKSKNLSRIIRNSIAGLLGVNYVNKNIGESNNIDCNNKTIELQERIESGNGKIDENAFKPQDINNPIFNNYDECCEYLALKAEKQAGILKKEDISKSINYLSKKYKMAKSQVIDIMLFITQFGSYKQLEKLGDELCKYNITDFDNKSVISMNKALYYISKKKGQIDLSANKKQKIAYILDNESTRYLEALNSREISRIKTQLDNDSMVFINLEGTGIKVGDKYYSYTALDGDINLEALTEAVILELKSGKNLDEICGGDFKKRIENVFGKEYAEKIININISSTDKNAESIANQVKHNIPNKFEIKITLDKFIETLDNYKDIKPHIRGLLLKYLDFMMEIYSPDTIAKRLKSVYKDIKDSAESICKTLDDVIYIYPYNEKSFDVIDYAFCRANNVSHEKFYFCDSDISMKKNKICVLLDDISASGDSLAFDPFCYKTFVEFNPKSNLFFAPVAVSSEAIKIINNQINENKENSLHHNDKLIYNSKNVTNLSLLTDKLPTRDKDLLLEILDSLGHINLGLCTSFPYMIPDNNSSLSGYLLSFTLNDNNPLANKTKKDNTLLSNLHNESQYNN